jgi:2-amino-4-hydroxy-6-hydroxymethyldihydropteridine diphosphokinase
LQGALDSLPDVVAVSSVYETDPVGGPAGQGPYLNAVVELDTGRSPRELLEIGRSLEDAAGRVRAERFGPRTLDVDVLLVGDLVIDEDDLVVPHPRMWERAFVLVPLAELAPELVPAGPTARDRGPAGGAVRLFDTLERS